MDGNLNSAKHVDDSWVSLVILLMEEILHHHV